MSNFGHYQSKCNARVGIKTNILIGHCLSHNINSKSFSRNKDHDPGYDRFTSEGFIINFDRTRIPIKIVRDTASLQSLITTNSAMACDYLDTSDERLIRGVTREVNKIPLVRVNFNSKEVNDLVTIGIHDGIPVGYDCLLGNDLVLQSDSNKEVTVVTRSRSKQECNFMSHPKLFNSVTRVKLLLVPKQPLLSYKVEPNNNLHYFTN